MRLSSHTSYGAQRGGAGTQIGRVEQVCRLERRTVRIKHGKRGQQVVYGVTSLSDEETSAHTLFYGLLGACYT